MLLLATGGDPLQRLTADDRAVIAFAEELAAKSRMDRLRAELETLQSATRDLPRVAGEIAALLADDDLAWRSYACALLADTLAN